MSADAAGTGPGEATPVVHTTVEALVRHRLSQAVGGWRGSLDGAAPTVAFVMLWTWRHDLRLALIAAGAVTVLLLLVRILTRSTTRYVLGSMLATALAAFFAMRSGRAEDAFLPGILTSCAYLVGIAVSLAARWPAVGFLVGLSDPTAAEDPMAWRRDPAILAVCMRLTWPLLVLYIARVGIMLPLYLANQVGWLGVAKIALGWPAWLLVLAVMAVMLGRGQTPIDVSPKAVADRSE